MSIDTRLRDGLQRSMSKLETDPELRLPDARRRGRRRLIARRVTVAVSVVASLTIVAASAAAVLNSPPRQGHEPATTPSIVQSPPADQQNEAPSLSDRPQQGILGSWQSQYVCRDLVQAYERAGVGRFAPGALVELHMVNGGPDHLASGHLCDGAVKIQRTHVFEPDGNVLNYQGSTVVDECRCYTLVGDHTLVNHADPGYPDISLNYEIDGDTLTFNVLVPDQCAVRCVDQVQYLVGQYALGPWHRVTNPAPIR